MTVRKLKWNEEYCLSFRSKDGVKFSTPFGCGFSLRQSLFDEVERLKARGFVDIKVFIREWS